MINRDIRKGNFYYGNGHEASELGIREEHYWDEVNQLCARNPSDKQLLVKERRNTFHGVGDKGRVNQKASRESFNKNSKNFNFNSNLGRVAVEPPFNQAQFLNNITNFNISNGEVKGISNITNGKMAQKYDKRRRTLPGGNVNYNQGSNFIDINNHYDQNQRMMQNLQYLNNIRNSCPGVGIKYQLNQGNYQMYMSNDGNKKKTEDYSSENSCSTRGSFLGGSIMADRDSIGGLTESSGSEDKIQTPTSKLKISEKINLSGNQDIFKLHKYQTTANLVKRIANHQKAVSQFTLTQQMNMTNSTPKSQMPKLPTTSFFAQVGCLTPIAPLAPLTPVDQSPFNSQTNLPNMNNSYQRNLNKQFNTCHPGDPIHSINSKTESSLNLHHLQNMIFKPKPNVKVDINNKKNTSTNFKNNYTNTCEASNIVNTSQNPHLSLRNSNVKLFKRSGHFGGAGKLKVSLSDKNLSNVYKKNLQNDLDTKSNTKTNQSPFKQAKSDSKLSLQIKVSETEHKELTIKESDDIYSTVKIFCEFNSLSNSLITPLTNTVTKAFCSLDNVLQTDLEDNEIEDFNNIYSQYQTYNEDLDEIDTLNFSSISYDYFTNDEEDVFSSANWEASQLNITL